MSTIKISELTPVSPLNANTSNVVFVVSDTQQGVTGKMTAATVAAGLFANTALNVGNNAVLFPGTIGQFASNNENYLQINLQNLDGNGSSDFIATSDIGTDTIYFIDLGIQGSTDTNGILKPLDGYVIVQGDTATNPGGNLIIGTQTTHRDIIFSQGGIEDANQVALFSYTSGLKLLQKPLTFADESTQNTSMTWVGAIANNTVGVDATQNTNIGLAWLQANTPSYTANSGATYANGAFIQANAAFNKANSALANTSGTFAGDLVITGTSNVHSNMMVSSSTYDYANIALMKIVGSTGALTQPPANPGYMLSITGVDGVSSRVINSSYGTGAYALFAGRKGNGTAGTPTAVANNDVIARFSGSGYNGSAFTTTGQGRIDIVADEDFTTANTGSRIEFYNTIPKTNTVTKIATFNATSAAFSGVLNPTKGFIYTPRVVSGNTTTAVIDFSTDSMVKLQVNAACTISMTNYTPGKVVEVWITNVSGSSRNITHGCSALNATNNNTDKALPATSSMKLQYFSIDGDLANTFVAVTQG